MLCVAEVKCYQCSRICGEVEGLRPQDLDLRRIRANVAAHLCGVKPGSSLRCSRCGGNIYVGDMECVYGYETPSRN